MSLPVPVHAFHGVESAVAARQGCHAHPALLGDIGFGHDVRSMEATMKAVRKVADFFDTVHSAIAVAACAREGRNPRARDLRQLGIDPDHYARIGRR